MSWEAWGTPEYLDWPECEECGGVGSVDRGDGDDSGSFACEACGGAGYEQPPERMEDDVI